ncbi:hypothetical protein Cob_v010094 [Colletotrichum orbiculare MAFF 240422]|uniref:Uncharacterized protein n=1 Tax=Colletotrichum orbiculare (strain 104-T / ATCC 96160 / CBS 514.97 / LARS 414 / MAFF 240422) TaxID=1213857 RepID=A0A484FH24_COLOR|nr:hypothetical protein Cob_v010094 [Colletotrichum orbiculare MAFF 240422]
MKYRIFLSEIIRSSLSLSNYCSVSQASCRSSSTLCAITPVVVQDPVIQRPSETPAANTPNRTSDKEQGPGDALTSSGTFSDTTLPMSVLGSSFPKPQVSCLHQALLLYHTRGTFMLFRDEKASPHCLLAQVRRASRAHLGSGQHHLRDPVARAYKFVITPVSLFVHQCHLVPSWPGQPGRFVDLEGVKGKTSGTAATPRPNNKYTWPSFNVMPSRGLDNSNMPLDTASCSKSRRHGADSEVAPQIRPPFYHDRRHAAGRRAHSSGSGLEVISLRRPYHPTTSFPQWAICGFLCMTTKTSAPRPARSCKANRFSPSACRSQSAV